MIEPLVASRAGAIERIGHWLLHGGAQIRTGPEAGGVAGWFDESGLPAFAYPEITGYYLTCLAFMREMGVPDPAVSLNANRAVAWLHQKFCGEAAPPTRCYRDPAIADWRNDATFSFDLSMIFRGLAVIRGLADERLRQETIDAVRRRLENLVSPDGHLLPCLTHDGRSVPYRWSTRPGPFQLKTAAALLHSGEPLGRDLMEAALRTFETWQVPFPVGDSPMHATLYGVEGLLLRALGGRAEAFAAARRQYELCVEHGASLQSDVAAQLLRAGCLLGGEKRGDLEATVAGFVGESGSVTYTARSLRHENTWSAMFSYQALTYCRRSHARQLLC